MVIVKADKNSEAGALPDQKLLAEMGKYNEELAKAGVLLAGEGLHPGSESEIEIRQVFGADDFGAEFTPELREQEERIRSMVEKR
jgi:hypothetical protein